MKTKMRKGSLLWFFTLLCFQLVLYCSSLDEVHTLESKDPNVSKHPLVAQEKLGTGSINLNTEGDGAENLEAKDHTFVTEKARRGKGSNGGVNVVHHPKHTDKAAASVLKSPFVLISTTNICISLSLLLVLPHLIA